MGKRISSISIKNFRSFAELSIPKLSDVTLITGKNNVGKSSLLEAIRMVTEGSPTTLYQIIRFREEHDPRPENEEFPTAPGDYTAFCSLFSGFPKLADCKKAFVIEAISVESESNLKLSARIDWFTQELLPSEGGRPLVHTQADLFGKASGVPALEIEVAHRKFYVNLNRPLRPRQFYIDASETNLIPCVFVDPTTTRSTSQLASLWDKIALRPAEEDIIKALQIIAPDIQAVSMVGVGPEPIEFRNRSRIAIVRSNQFSHPVPLRTYGDGVNRLFGLILSLSCAENGVLVIDEIENGIHYTMLPLVWKTLFLTAKKLNVQIFATTHSWDCVEAFQQAVSHHPEEGILLRLSNKGSQVIPTIFDAEELKIATREHIEVR